MASFLLDQYANSESRFQIYALETSVRFVKPGDPAAHDAVLVGHSMGGIISRLLVSDADITKPALEMMTIRQQNRFKKHPMVTERLQMHSISNFDRAIFWHRHTEVLIMQIVGLPWQHVKLSAYRVLLSAVATSLTTENLDIKRFLE